MAFLTGGEGHGNPLQYSCLENTTDGSVVSYSPWGWSNLQRVGHNCSDLVLSILTGVKWYLMVVLICISLIIINAEIFSQACWPSIWLLWRSICLGLLPSFSIRLFVFLFNIELHELFIYMNSLSVASLWNIVSHLLGCLSVLFMISFALQNLLSLIRSHLLIFAFVSITQRDESRKILLWFMSGSVVPMFFSMNFIASHLTFRSLIPQGFLWCSSF